MRRLPVFFVLDCSESMIGENLKKMNEGLQMIVSDLIKDPHALETVWISVIAFAGVARTIVPLHDIISFYPPRLPIGGGTSLGAALRELSQQIDSQVRKTTSERKGDWKPVVYLLTDGRPTDNVNEEITRWRAEYASKVTFIAVGLGSAADLGVLRRITENVLLFTESKEGDFTRFIKWITASVTAQSRSVGDETRPPLITTETIVTLAKDEVRRAWDENCVVLNGRCSKTGRPYLMKYERPEIRTSGLDFNLNLNKFDLSGCFPIDEEYFTWSDAATSVISVNTSELQGVPGCPHCGNSSAFAMCQFGKLLCIDGPDDVVCPWCQKGLSFSNDHGNNDFDVNRGRG
ncbi:MAG: hypothetical protein XXXJIFNMEKO3_01929 [Candidatus Erwinia impunctatus]|nr:hypothetical protein XXXJIFNMEKO_01929 [Culicoides impunctatus]